MDQENPVAENFRYIAYRSTFCLLIKTGSAEWKTRATVARLLKRRIILPNCCVLKIRNAYPDPQGNYRGFIDESKETIEDTYDEQGVLEETNDKKLVL